MLHGSPARGPEPPGANLENNNPASSSGDGDSVAAKGKLRKAGRKLRSSAPLLHHHKAPRGAPRGGPSLRLSDHNNNPRGPATGPQHRAPRGPGLPRGPATGPQHRAPRGPGLPRSPATGPQHRAPRGPGLPRSSATGPEPPSVPGLLHLKPGAKKELKSKGGRSEVRVRPLCPEPKRPLHASDNMEPAAAAVEEGEGEEKAYAGAKFSEPPSPSVLPRPPSRWVGGAEPPGGRRQQMSVHLKSLLKVQDAS